MNIQPLSISGAFSIDLTWAEDERGGFARTFDAEIMQAHGMESRFVQCSMSRTTKAFTVRGMHWQAAPHDEAKLVRVVQGRSWHAIIDVRADSKTTGQWFGLELSAKSGRALYIPPFVAHGFQSQEDETIISYQMSGAYAPEAARGVRWDDPAFGVDWPVKQASVIHERDATYPLWNKEAAQ